MCHFLSRQAPLLARREGWKVHPRAYVQIDTQCYTLLLVNKTAWGGPCLGPHRHSATTLCTARTPATAAPAAGSCCNAGFCTSTLLHECAVVGPLHSLTARLRFRKRHQFIRFERMRELTIAGHAFIDWGIPVIASRRPTSIGTPPLPCHMATYACCPSCSHV